MYRWKFQPRGYVKYTSTTYRWFIRKWYLIFFFLLFVFLFSSFTVELVEKKVKISHQEQKKNRYAIYLGTRAITAGKITMIYRIIGFSQGGIWFTVSAISAYLRRSRYFVIGEPRNKLGMRCGTGVRNYNIRVATTITDYCIVYF